MSSILTDIGAVVQAVMTWFTTLFTSVSNLFYDSTATTPQFTFIGVLLLVAFGLGVVWVVIKFIQSLVKRG